MPKSIIIKKNGGPEVLELQDVDVGSPGPDEIKVTGGLGGLGGLGHGGLFGVSFCLTILTLIMLRNGIS